MKALKLPDYLRAKLREEVGEVIEGQNYLEVALRANKVLEKCGLIVAVGDIVCSTLIASNNVPDICIIDGKTRREDVGISVSSELFDVVSYVRNPPGHITEEASSKIREAVNRVIGSCRKLKFLIITEGEEDLLALPALLHIRDGDCVTYGIPNKGMAIIRINDQVREMVRSILNMFEEVEVIP